MPSSASAGKILRLGPAADERVLDLQVDDGVHRVRAADRLGADLGEADVRARSRPSPGRRSRRWCPRSAPPDRGAPGGRCRCGRRRGASGCRRGSSSPRPGARRSRASCRPGRAARRTSPRAAPGRGGPRAARPIEHLVVAHAVEVAGVEQRDAARRARRGWSRCSRARRRRRTCPTCPCSRARAETPPGPSRRAGELRAGGWRHARIMNPRLRAVDAGRPAVIASSAGGLTGPAPRRRVRGPRIRAP